MSITHGYNDESERILVDTFCMQYQRSAILFTYFWQYSIPKLLSSGALINSVSNNTNVTKGQTKTLEDVQRRAVQIISGNIPYEEEACRLLNILPLADRRLELCRLFHQIMRDDTHVLRHLLPPKRDTQLTVTGRLRSSRTYPTVYARTSHFKNSLSYMD